MSVTLHGNASVQNGTSAMLHGNAFRIFIVQLGASKKVPKNAPDYYFFAVFFTSSDPTDAEITPRSRQAISAPHCVGTRFREKQTKRQHWIYHRRRAIRLPSGSAPPDPLVTKREPFARRAFGKKQPRLLVGWFGFRLCFGRMLGIWGEFRVHEFGGFIGRF